jgi:hypothetical protein
MSRPGWRREPPEAVPTVKGSRTLADSVDDHVAAGNDLDGAYRAAERVDKELASEPLPHVGPGHVLAVALQRRLLEPSVEVVIATGEAGQDVVVPDGLRAVQGRRSELLERWRLDHLPSRRDQLGDGSRRLI